MKKEGKIGRKSFVARLVLGAAVSVLLLLGVAINCTTKQAGEDQVLRFGMFAGSYWDVPNGNCYKIIDDAIMRFELAHPGVKVEYVSGILKEDYSEWLSEQVLLGKEPDVFMIPAGELDMLASSRIIKNLNSLIERDKSFSKESYYQAAYRYGTIKQKQFALPYESVTTLMFVNKTLLQKEGIAMPGSGWNWDDFLSICRQVTKDTDHNGITDQFGYYGYSWQDAAYSNGLSLFSEDGTSSFFGDERMEAALKYVKELEEINQGYTVTSKDFDKGKVAFRPLAFSEYRTYKPYPWRIKKYSDFEWDCVKMPSGPAGGSRTELNTLLMGISSRTGRGDLAWEFMKTLCYEEDTQRELLEQSQGMPVIRKVTESPQLQSLLNNDTPGRSGSVDMNIIGQVMDEAVETPNFRLYPAAMVMADGEICRILKGEASMDSGLLKLQREINGLLKQ
ncbi:ABC transporter substrate-binding protein [Lacrimispora sp.]|uniref:ABC transporter substrate-binding protein n=1 Tax=Lacrimispora sp. TaxID=2719234 RepID=UPI0028AA49C8|nr:extracellular solute-binding protein [Lacrimispora sp.]